MKMDSGIDSPESSNPSLPDVIDNNPSKDSRLHSSVSNVQECKLHVCDETHNSVPDIIKQQNRLCNSDAPFITDQKTPVFAVDSSTFPVSTASNMPSLADFSKAVVSFFPQRFFVNDGESATATSEYSSEKLDQDTNRATSPCKLTLMAADAVLNSRVGNKSCKKEIQFVPLLSESYHKLLSEEYQMRQLVPTYKTFNLPTKSQRNLITLRARERMLTHAVSLNNIEMVEHLLQQNVDPKITDGKRRSPLHIAASKGYSGIVRLLLQHGADPNQKDEVGNTALHLAACTSHIPTVTILLKAGTDLKLVDNMGFSPLQIAKSKLNKMISYQGSDPSSEEIKREAFQVIEMMKTYLYCSGNNVEAALLTSFSDQLSLSDTQEDVENDIKSLLTSLQDLSLNKSKQA